MKNKIVKPFFSFLAFTIAITTAFAYSSGIRSEQALYVGYKRVGHLCVATDVLCTNVNTGVICKDASNNTLYRLNGTGQCPEQLWKPLP